MRRFFYRALIALHPPRFRERFGDEMLCVFDESGRSRTARLFVDGVLSLLRQWLLRSNLWKMAAGAAISALLLLAWGNAMVYGVDVSLMRGSRWHDRLAMNPWLGEPQAPFDETEFEREAAEAASLLSGIRKTEAQKQHKQPHDTRHAAPFLPAARPQTRAEMAAALDARGLRKCYTATPAVSDVTFSLQAGEVLGCLGANGAGKSTIVKMLTGLSEPTRGQVLSCGVNIYKDLVAYRRRLGYVPEEPELYAYLSGWEYLEMVGTLRGMPRAPMTKKIEALLALFSLAPHRHASIGSYSKGMRQRVLLIAALLHDPEILILDEPLSGLDVVSAMIVKSLIKTLGERGKAIFYCSHVLEVVEKVCSHVMILRKGNVIAYAPTAELHKMVGQASLEQAFVHLMADRDAEETASEIVKVMSAGAA